jgi:TolA-binding protein
VVAAAENPDSAPVVDSQPVPVVTPDNIPQGVNIPDAGTNADLSAAIARDAEGYAYSRAYNDVVPDYLSRQQELQTGLINNVADLRTELATNQRQIDALDATVQQRTVEYQAQRMKFKEARSQALKDIEAEKAQIADRNAEINQTLERNAAAEQARGRQSQIGRGEIPAELAGIIDQRAQEIRSGMQMSPVAGAVRTAATAVREADWSVNQQAYRAAVAHMMEGRTPDIEPF